MWTDTTRAHYACAELALPSDLTDAEWAAIATLVENCKLSGITPHSWMNQTLEKLATGHPAKRVGELLPCINVV